jgi:photosystem II stability/assembly factor-like uncharacterized protein
MKMLHKAMLVHAAIWTAVMADAAPRAARLSIAAGAAGGQERAGDPRAAECAGDGRHRLVTAGQRGHVLYSDDGKTWVQAEVPLSSDLTALSLPERDTGLGCRA